MDEPDRKARQSDLKRRNAEQLLQRIADAVGCPVESFDSTAHSDASVTGAAELLQLWFEIESADARGELLQLARRAAARTTS